MYNWKLKVIKIIEQFVKLSDEAKAELNKRFVKESFPKKTNILTPDKTCEKLYFIVEGAVRTFYLHDDKEVSSWIYTEDEIFTSWYSYLMSAPSFEYIQALEDTEVISLKLSDFNDLYDDFPEMERFMRLYMEKQMAIIDYIYKGYQYLSAKEKYEALMEFNPQLFLRVKLGHIASLLGISQETLSRIRSGKA